LIVSNTKGDTTMSNEFAADFSSFDDSYNPESTSRFVNLNDLPQGEYEFLIEEAKLDRIPSTGEAIVRLGLKILKGQMIGAKFDRTYFFRTEQSANYFGADLVLLGLPAQTWTAANGKKWSVEMPKAVPTLKGKAFKGNIKVTNKGYHNLNIVGLVTETPKVAMPDSDGMPF